jgi:hypothetical protein
VREVLSLLTSYCLVQSTAYPPADELDPHLSQLLRERNATLERYARQDVDAAQLLGRMVSGYATLRRFYELRDGLDWDKASAARWLAQRRRAASALVAVIASADDNIRGGLLDPTRDSVVSEDFLLALLGEATVFFSSPDKSTTATTTSGRPQSSNHHRTRHDGVPVVSLAQVDTLLKAVEDLETVTPRVRRVCAAFYNAALQSAPGGASSTPADLLARASAAGKEGEGSFVLAGSALLASRTHREVGSDVVRGWDWRKGVTVRRTGDGDGGELDDGAEMLGRLRVGLAGELARLWVEEADHMAF